MKTIAILLNSYHNAGPSNVMKNIMRILSESGHRIILITLLKKNGPYEIDAIERIGVKVFQLDYGSKMDAIANAPDALRNIVMEQKIDIVHSNSLITDAISVLSDSKAKRLCTLHNNMFYNYYGHYGKQVSEEMIRIHLSILQQMDMCVCCSTYIYNDIKKHVSNTTVIHNGVDAISFSQLSKRELSLPSDSIVYTYAGVLKPSKGALWMAESFSKVRNADEYLLVLGEGEDRQRITQINDSNIRVYGFVDHPEEYFSLSDIYTSASSSEGFSLSVLEALSSGNYLLLSDIPSHKEVFESCPSHYLGNLFDNGDLNSFNNALMDLRGRLKNKNREQLQQVAREAFSAIKMAEGYERLYLSLLS